MTSLLAKLDAQILKHKGIIETFGISLRTEILTEQYVVSELEQARQAVLELRLAVEAINPEEEPESDGAGSMQRQVLALIGESKE